ncbi:MAG TPA: glycosyl hydrolase [Tepidisphaeraceae bacterium]|jgi:mannan endo-1,4-beta-mannosidase
MKIWTIMGLLALAASASAQSTEPPATRPASRPAQRAWVNPQPDVPFLPKPAARPADWLVEHPPVSPNASAEVRALLKYLYAISGKQTLTGQHNYADEKDASTQQAARWSRKTPVIYGIDFGFSAEGDKDSAYVRPRLVEEMRQQWLAGSIITVTWHEVRPTDTEPVTFMGSIRQKLTDAQFEELLTPGTPLHGRWQAKTDEIAGYLKQLEAHRVPILYRPYHEINGNWFWWNGRRGDRGSKVLYRMAFDRLVRHHKLTNLIWVWNADQPSQPDRQFVDYFPGHDTVDVLSFDNYGTFQQRFYDEMNALSEGKPMAIGECSMPPAPDDYKTQPKWAWYMVWAQMAGPPRPRRASTRNAAAASQPAAPPPPAVTLADIAAAPRFFSLQDEAYWQSVNPMRTQLGLPAGQPYPAPPPWQPATQPTTNP